MEKVKKQTTASRSAENDNEGRPKPLIPKSGYTKSGKRTYANERKGK